MTCTQRPWADECQRPGPGNSNQEYAKRQRQTKTNGQFALGSQAADWLAYFVFGMRAHAATVGARSLIAGATKDIRARAEVTVTLTGRLTGSLAVRCAVPAIIWPKCARATISTPAADPVLLWSLILAVVMIQ